MARYLIYWLHLNKINILESRSTNLSSHTATVCSFYKLYVKTFVPGWEKTRVLLACLIVEMQYIARTHFSSCRNIITKTCLYNFDPLKPHFYIVKLGFTGVYIIFLISAQNIDCGYSLEPPHWGSSNEYPQSKFWAEVWKISELLSENFQFLVVKLSIYLNRLFFL